MRHSWRFWDMKSHCFCLLINNTSKYRVFKCVSLEWTESKAHGYKAFMNNAVRSSILERHYLSKILYRQLDISGNGLLKNRQKMYIKTDCLYHWRASILNLIYNHLPITIVIVIIIKLSTETLDKFSQIRHMVINTFLVKTLTVAKAYKVIRTDFVL